MKNLALVLLLASIGQPALPAETHPYDSGEMREVMHSNLAAADAIGKGVAAGDWMAVANGFMQFARNAQAALLSAPPKGDPAEWQRIWEDVLYAAYRGVGAAGENDPAKVKAALDQIVGDRNQGHPKFKG